MTVVENPSTINFETKIVDLIQYFGPNKLTEEKEKSNLNLEIDLIHAVEFQYFHKVKPCLIFARILLKNRISGETSLQHSRIKHPSREPTLKDVADNLDYLENLRSRWLNETDIIILTQLCDRCGQIDTTKPRV